ncbi:hypothetical protein NX035_20800, partial [Escherichia coli]|nr:hypothetical protein [Escherichia coli]
ILAFDNHTNGPLTDLRGKAHIFSHPVYLSLKEFSLQDSRGDSLLPKIPLPDRCIGLNVKRCAEYH